jgi:hypothetical protein
MGFKVFFFFGYFVYLHFKCYSTLLVSPWKPPTLPPFPSLHEDALPSTHPLLRYCPIIPLLWDIKHSQNPGIPLLLIPDKAILCHLFSWSHGSLHVYSLVGGLVPGSSGGLGWLILLFHPWVCKPLHLLQFFLQLLHWGSSA